MAEHEGERKGESIYVRNEAGGLEPLMEKRFGEEKDLQALLAKHPELLEGTQIRPNDPRRWILITREQPIERWSLDHLVIDQDATPTLVEVKLGANPDARRKVVGQMLDYAAHAHTLDVTELRRAFEKQSNADDLLNDFITGRYDNARTFWEQVARNLKEKRLRLLFVADAIPDELARIVEFLNEQMPDIEVLAVEVKQFIAGTESQTLVPRVIGRLAKPNRSTTTSQDLYYRKFWEEFLDVFGQTYKDWRVHKSSDEDLTKPWLAFDSCGKARQEMHYSFDYANSGKTMVNFWVGASNKHIFLALLAQKDEIEKRFSERQFNESLSWDPVERGKRNGIHILHPGERLTIGDPEPWPDVRDWAIQRLGALRDAIQPHLDSQ